MVVIREFISRGAMNEMELNVVAAHLMLVNVANNSNRIEKLNVGKKKVAIEKVR